MSIRPEGPKEWDPETGALPTGTRMRDAHKLVEDGGWGRMPGRRWVVCWTEDIVLTEEEAKGERPAFEHYLGKVGVANEADTNSDVGYTAYVDHTNYFEEGMEADAIEFYKEISKTAHNATLAMSLMDTEW